VLFVSTEYADRPLQILEYRRLVTVIYYMSITCLSRYEWFEPKNFACDLREDTTILKLQIIRIKCYETQ
jgi:hypothetical protein